MSATLAHSDERAAAALLGDLALARRALGIGQRFGLRWRARFTAVEAALADANVRFELRPQGGMMAGRCILSEYYDAGDRIVIYEDAIAHVAERVRALALDDAFPADRLVALATAHELFHWIHRRKERAEIDTALGCARRVFGFIPIRSRAFAAEEVAAHAFAAAFHGFPRTAVVLESLLLHDQEGSRS